MACGGACPCVGTGEQGVIMPTLTFLATKYMWENDVLSLHLPQLDASGIATRAKIFNKPSILTYHSDLLMPPSLINNLAVTAVNASNTVAANLCDLISAYTEDFAKNSPYLSKYLDKVRVIAPPVEIPVPDPNDIKEFKENYGLEGRTTIGIGVRLAAEKGMEYLLEALPRILEKYPTATIVHAGPVRLLASHLICVSWNHSSKSFSRQYVYVVRLTHDKWRPSLLPAM